MDLNTILSLGAALFNATRGGSAGSGGGSSFFTPAPTGGTSTGASTDWGSILTALGQTAGQFKATPRAGASRKDVEKANRINILTGLLGGGAQIAGGLMSQQRKGEAYGALGDLLAGKTTTTGQPITPSGDAVGGVTPTVIAGAPASTDEGLARLLQQYPDMAKDMSDIVTKRREAEQKQYLEELKAATKGMESPQTRQARAEYYARIGAPKEAIPQLIERDIAEEAAARESRIGAIQQKYGRGSTISPALRGLGGIESMAPEPVLRTLPGRFPQGETGPAEEIYQKMPIRFRQGQEPNLADINNQSSEEIYQKMPIRFRQGQEPNLADINNQSAARVAGAEGTNRIEPEQFPEMYRRQAEEAAALLGGEQASVETPKQQAPILRGEAATSTPTPTATQFQEDEILQRLETQQKTLADQKSSIEGKPTKSIQDYYNLQRINADLNKVEGQLPQVRNERDRKYQAVREEINRISTPYAKVLSKGARANDLYATIKTQLNQNTRIGDELAIKTLIQSIDDSVVHPTEQAAALASLISKREQLVRLAQSYAGINNPLDGAIKNQLLKLANDIRSTSLQSYRRAEDAITNVAIRRVKGDFSARLSDYDQQYTTIGDIAGQLQQQAPAIRGITGQAQSPLAGLSPTPTATPAARRRYQQGMFSQ